MRICGNCCGFETDGKQFSKDKKGNSKLRKYFELDNLCDDCYPIMSQKLIEEEKLLNEDSKTLCEYYHKRQKLSKTKKK